MLRRCRLTSIRGYCVSASQTGSDRDPRKYLQSNEDLVFLRSPRTMLFKAETAVELCHEISSALQTRKFSNPATALNMIDAISCILCLTLDPAEVVRSIHPREEFKGQSDQAFEYAFKFLSELNTQRSFYKHVVALTESDAWSELSPEQRYYVTTLKHEMESVGITLSPAKAKLVSKLLEEKERKAEEVLSVADSSGTRDPEAQIGDLLVTRHELAETLGFDSYISWSMMNTLAADPIEVWKVLLKLANDLQPTAREEIAHLAEVKNEVSSIRSLDQPDYIITDSEKRDLSAIVRNRQFAGIEAELKNYLSVSNVWKGLEILVSELFGLTMERSEMTNHEKYDKNLQKFKIFTNPRKGSEEKKLVGTMYADLFVREGKPTGSGHYTIQVGNDFDPHIATELDIMMPSGDKLSPIVVFSCDCKGAFAELDPRMFIEEKRKIIHDWDTVLLEPSEVVSIFHEFGHCLHTLLGQTQFQSLSGTRSSMDYIEVFSQITELYARDYRSLRRWATHHTTGLPIPKELCDEMQTLESSFGSLTQLDEIVSALVDLTYHGPRPLTYYTLDPNDNETLIPRLVPEGFDRPVELRKLLSDSLSPIQVTELGIRRNFVSQHLVTYPGTYYSYTFSRVFASAIWNKHFEADPYSWEAGEKLREVMSKGGSAPPRQLISKLLPDMTIDDIYKVASA
eukprot:TRINITY_DN31455_c0_g1_i1.p1 TRINITY_DN31455_c0_g1~~TRINITY_DN31455_c0_g1_i1.p1  ORF type:complete len:683 (+),score=103.91 TRINITY_DN31455_c0_g1_i1:82-2130(+)